MVVRCQACQRDNPEDAWFCGQCGQRLPLVCSDCGRANEADSTFCNGCGHRLAAPTPGPAATLTPPHLVARILRDRAALQGERRTITVLFIDGVSSVAAGEKLDHEEFHRMTRECTERMVAAVHRFEGTVAQFRGDGIMAMFGAPVAHEDTARRGIAAALAMRESLRAYRTERGRSQLFEYRIGLNTGPVIVGRIGDDLSMDYTAIGDTVNLAARMEQWAPPGKIYVTDATYRLAAGHFEFAELGALEIKGKSEPVRAYEVLRELPARTRLEVAAEGGLTPYVGRSRELDTLDALLGEAKSGRGQVVFISGEAGIGKSRMLLEFRRSLGDEDVTWLSGQCISYGRNSPYLPVVDLLKNTFGVEETDTDADVTRRVENRAGNWDDATKRAAPYVRFLLNVDPGDERVAMMDPAERRAGILDALRALLLRGASQRPVIMVFEDLHWVDEKSAEAIGALADVVAGQRALLILTYRPGYTHPFGDREHYSRLALRHLPADESAVLLERVLDVATCPEEIRKLITAKAEGNPFFLEEVTKALIESGVVRRTADGMVLSRPLEQAHIPETIHEVILARIDRLERDAREAMQLASVIGREFTVRLLDRISEERGHLDGLLGELKTLELIYEKAYFPELSYMFKHALTHEVAYSTLLGDRRRALHRMVGMAVEELYADRLPEHYETLAHHFEQAEEWPKALDYLVKASEKADAAYASRDALLFLERAMAVCERIGGRELTTLAELARRHGYTLATLGDLDASMLSFDRGVAAAQSIGDRQSELRLMAYRGMGQMYLHEFEDAEKTMRIVVEAQDEADAQTYATAEMLLASQQMILGEVERAEETLARAEDIARNVTDGVYQGLWTIMRSAERNWRADYRTAVTLTDDLEDRDEMNRRRIPFGEATGVLWIRGLALAGRGDYSEALDVLHESLAMSDRMGEVIYRARTLNSIGWILNELRDFEHAIEWNNRSVEAALDIQAPDPEIECNAWLNLADAYVALGEFDRAEELVGAVERVVRDPRPQDRWALWLYSQHMCATAADLWLARGDPDRALTYADECIERAVSSTRPKNEVKGRRARGLALLVEGGLPEAEVELTKALSTACEIGNPAQIWKCHAAMGELRIAQGRDDEAAAEYGRALDTVEEVAARLHDDALRSTLLGSKLVSSYRERARR